MRLRQFAFIALLLLVFSGCAGTDTGTGEKDSAVTDLILATTTSTQDSGLLDVLVPMFEEEYKYNVKTVAVGTGQALEMGTNGEADVLLTHAPASEQVLVDNGDAINYKRVMYNDFIIVGPTADPAEIKGLSVLEAFTKIFESGSVFISRGDDSGTHKKELGIWKNLNLTPAKNAAYVETGQGMGASIQIAAEKLGYVLTDRATYLAQKENFTDMEITVEGDEDLLNIYHVMQVNPDKNDKINENGAKAFVEFMISDSTQEVIGEFGKKEYGQALFFPYTE